MGHHKPAVLRIWPTSRRGEGILEGLLFLSLLFASSKDATGQSLALPPWDVLAQESSVVVVGDVVEGQMWVISHEEWAKAEVTPDGRPTFPNPSELVLGIFSRVHVRETLKPDGKLKPGSIIGVFVHGYGGSDSPHVLIDKERCVLFLRSMKGSGKELTNTVVVPRGALGSPEKHLRFEPGTSYTPVREGFAQVILTPGREQILDEVRQAIAKRPKKTK